MFLSLKILPVLVRRKKRLLRSVRRRMMTIED